MSEPLTDRRLREHLGVLCSGGVAASTGSKMFCAYCCTEQPEDQPDDAAERHLPDCELALARAALERDSEGQEGRAQHTGWCMVRGGGDCNCPKERGVRLFSATCDYYLEEGVRLRLRAEAAERRVRVVLEQAGAALEIAANDLEAAFADEHEGWMPSEGEKSPWENAREAINSLYRLAEAQEGKDATD